MIIVYLHNCLMLGLFFCSRHTLSKRKVVPLPIWKANPETDADALFEKDTVSMVPLTVSHNV